MPEDIVISDFLCINQDKCNDGIQSVTLTLQITVKMSCGLFKHSLALIN